MRALLARLTGAGGGAAPSVLLGIMPVAAAPSEDGFLSVGEGPLRAVLAAAPQGRSGGREALLARLTHEHRDMERLLVCGDLLAAPGRPQLDPREAAAALAEAEGPVADALTELAGAVQWQVTVRWDPGAALARYVASPELAGARDAAALAVGAERLRLRLGAAWTAHLAAVSRSVMGLPPGGPETVLNAVILVSRESEDALDAALARIDAAWPEGLRIRAAGPMPPASFLRLSLCRASAQDVRIARAALGIAPEAGPGHVDAAFARRLRAEHPDHGGRDGRSPDLDALRAARDLLRRPVPEAPRFVVEGPGVSAPAREAVA